MGRAGLLGRAIRGAIDTKPRASHHEERAERRRAGGGIADGGGGNGGGNGNGAPSGGNRSDDEEEEDDDDEEAEAEVVYQRMIDRSKRVDLGEMARREMVCRGGSD